MSFFNQSCCELPVWTILAGVAVTALASGLLSIRHVRRVKRLRQYRDRARQMLMEVRRACILPQATLPLQQVPGMVRRIKMIAGSGGFRLNDIGTSERQLDKFLMIARDGQPVGRRPRNSPVHGDERRFTGHRRPFFERPHAIELPPTDNGDAAPTAMVIEKYPTEGGQPPDRPDQWSDFVADTSVFDTSRPLLDEEIVIELDDEDFAPPADGELPAAPRIGERWFSSEDLGGEAGAGVDELFDRIVRSDEEAKAEPARAVTIRVDGKKFGF